MVATPRRPALTKRLDALAADRARPIAQKKKGPPRAEEQRAAPLSRRAS